jgi:hypothetical protein
VFDGEILDISALGAFFAPAGGERSELARNLVIGERLALRFEEAGLAGLELPGRVCWIGRSPLHGRIGIGVAFSHLPLG